MDDNEPKFKDGTTTTSDVDLRESSGSLTFYDDVIFNADVRCKNLIPISSTKAVVNKNTLETGGLVGIQSLTSSLRNVLSTPIRKELLIMKSKPTNYTIIHKDSSLNGNPSVATDSDSVALDISFTNDLPNGIYKYIFDLYFSSTKSIKIFLYGECGGTGFKSNKWNVTLQGNETEVNSNGGYVHRGYGQRLTFSGEFRNFGDHIRGLGISYSVNSAGVYNKFLKQELDTIPSEPKLLGLSMAWLFEEENGASVDLTDDS